MFQKFLDRSTTFIDSLFNEIRTKIIIVVRFTGSYNFRMNPSDDEIGF